MNAQVPFDLSYAAPPSAADYVMSASNQLAVAWINKFPAWPACGLLLLGAAGSGKSFLGNLWQQKSGADKISTPQQLEAAVAGTGVTFFIDDADVLIPSAPQAMFHLYNRVQAAGGHVLLAASVPLAGWALTLPDLVSRLQTLPSVQIEAPDDELLQGLLAAHFARRGVALKPEVVAYLLPRLPRSAAGVAQFAVALDQFALAAGKGITLPVVRTFFTNWRRY